MHTYVQIQPPSDSRFHARHLDPQASGAGLSGAFSVACWDLQSAMRFFLNFFHVMIYDTYKQGAIFANFEPALFVSQNWRV